MLPITIHAARVRIALVGNGEAARRRLAVLDCAGAKRVDVKSTRLTAQTVQVAAPADLLVDNADTEGTPSGFLDMHLRDGLAAVAALPQLKVTRLCAASECTSALIRRGSPAKGSTRYGYVTKGSGRWQLGLK